MSDKSQYEGQSLALNGGDRAVSRALLPYSSVGQAELEAVQKVFERGSLSGFYGSWGDEFLGGVEIKAFEKEWAQYFGVKHAISMNSATSCLYAAIGALGIGPGDEVIVPPFTMSATVVAPLIYGAIPVFVDIEPETFCLDAEKVVAAITDKTKAIIAVNLFGHPARLKALKALAEQRGIQLIEDNAQGPLAREDGRFAGTVGDIGVFSLNYHKHIHSGEGGLCVTDDDDLAMRLQAIRNHAENIVEPAGIENIANLIGFNYRMTEMSAAVGRSQLKKVESEVGARQQIAQQLSEGLHGLEGITVPEVRPGCDHVYYVWAVRLDPDILGVSREKFSQALIAEGFPVFNGYVKPLYMLPLFQRRIGFGNSGWPFTLTNRTYERGLCPVSERMYETELVCFETCAYSIDDDAMSQLLTAFRKVYHMRHKLG